MRHDQREGKIGGGAEFHLGEPPAHAEAAAIQQEIIVRMRMPRDDGQPAENRDMDVGVEAFDA